MAEKVYEKDEFGKEIASGAAKWLSPDPTNEDMTRVYIGPDATDYVYVDPASLFALERLVKIMKTEGKGRFVRSRAKGFKKFVKDVCEEAMPWWPDSGYIIRIAAVPGAKTSADAGPAPAPAPAPAADPQLNFPEPDLINEDEDTEEEFEDPGPIVDDVNAWASADNPA